jgi:hypothetical protein
MTCSMNVIAYILIYQTYDLENPGQSALVFIVFCKFLSILKSMMLNHISRMVFGSVLVINIVNNITVVSSSDQPS